MKIRITFLLILITCITTSLYTQEKCGSHTYLQQKKQQLPQLELAEQEFANRIMALQGSRGITEHSGIIKIPVVVHVVYNNSAQNISDAQIYSAIDILNKDFSATNPDTVLLSHPFHPLLGNPKIEFCMAAVDPQNNPTTAITRKYTSQAVFDLDLGTADNVKFSSYGGQDAWDPAQYLNIWICNLQLPLLGYAQFPSTMLVDPWANGIVIDYRQFGNIGAAIASDGRTTTHEIGHYLGLRHIWGDVLCGNDLIDDTPPAEDKNFGCPTFPHNANSLCGSDMNGEMYMNYMDYSDGNCMSMFSKGQVEVMRSVMFVERYELSKSTTCDLYSSINSEGSDLFFSINSMGNGVYDITLDSRLHGKNVVLKLIDISGKEIQVKNSIAADHLQVTLSENAAGIYILQLHSENYIKKIKLVK